MAAKTVLFVDDEEIVVGVGKQMLEKLGFSVLTAKNGVEALDVYKNNQNDIDIIILDMIMPDMGAADTYVELQSINPVIKVLLSSGYGTDHQTRELLSLGCSGFIQKPFNLSKLSQNVRTILDEAKASYRLLTQTPEGELCSSNGPGIPEFYVAPRKRIR